MSRMLRPDEIELWRRVIANVRPRVSHAPYAFSHTPHPPPHPPPQSAPVRETSVKPTIRLKPPSPKPLAKPKPFDARTLRDLRKRRLTVEARLDLHGMRVAEAHQALVGFIQRASAQGFRIALIVTGKGRSFSPDPFHPYGVLRRQAPIWLAEQPLSHLVSGFGPALPADGGEGAFYVRLRRPTAPRHA